MYITLKKTHNNKSNSVRANMLIQTGADNQHYIYQLAYSPINFVCSTFRPMYRKQDNWFDHTGFNNNIKISDIKIFESLVFTKMASK